MYYGGGMNIYDYATSGGKNLIMEYVEALPAPSKAEILAVRQLIREKGMDAFSLLVTRQLFQDSLASLARRMRVDMSCFSKTCQHLPNRIRAHPRGAFILHRGIVPTMKRVSLFARVSHD
jgi:hypothetical protein